MTEFFSSSYIFNAFYQDFLNSTATSETQIEDLKTRLKATSYTLFSYYFARFRRAKIVLLQRLAPLSPQTLDMSHLMFRD